MEEDEFNDFQHPDSQQPQKSHQITHQAERRTQEQGDSFDNVFFNFDAKNANPSSSLATMTFQQVSEKKDSKDFEDNYWPHLNKIQSQNLPTLEQNFITFQKSHSQSEYKIDLFDFSNTFILQNKAVIGSDINVSKVQLAQPQSIDIKLTQNSKPMQSFLFIDPFQPNSNQVNHTKQNNALTFENDFLNKEKPSGQVEFSQEKEENKNFNIQLQNDNFRKQSEQFVFVQPVQTVSFQQNNIKETKQSEQFLYQSQQKPLQTFFTQTASSILQQVNLEKEQTLKNLSNTQHDEYSQLKINNSSNLSSKEQENNIINPIIITQTVKTTYNNYEEDQFGNFEETVPDTYIQSHIATLETQINSEKHQSVVQLYEQQVPFGVESSSKKKQLQKLIDSLPDYKIFFAKAFQSL